MNCFKLVRPLPAIFSMPKVVHYYICLQPAKQGSNEISRSHYQQLGDAIDFSVGGGTARAAVPVGSNRRRASEQQLGEREGGNGSGPEARSGGGGGATRQLVRLLVPPLTLSPFVSPSLFLSLHLSLSLSLSLVLPLKLKSD